ncbi:hypothetical protein O3P69_013099 [Scylla paramamosain]|uniref:Secreted protein n=1 Tax=Scylla paramamosain TaxID=85552 RepID=A0AAW0TZZ8_SCYPA
MFLLSSIIFLKSPVSCARGRSNLSHLSSFVPSTDAPPFLTNTRDTPHPAAQANDDDSEAADGNRQKVRLGTRLADTTEAGVVDQRLTTPANGSSQARQFQSSE